MGWNTGYTIFEQTVVGAYDLGKLDKALLSVLMEPYRGSDIDSGGSQDLVAKDGLGVEQIVVKVWCGETLVKPPGFEKAWKDQTEEERDDDERYFDALYERFAAVTKEFGWR